MIQKAKDDLKNMSQDEARLWVKTERIYGITPMELLPLGEYIDWNSTTYKKLPELLSCPAFQKSLDLFKYAILLAKHYRTECTKPSREMITGSRNKDVFEALENAAIDLNVETNAIQKTA